MRVAMVSEHANPLATIGGVDAGGQNVHVAALAAALSARGHEVTVFTRRDDPSQPNRLSSGDGYTVEFVPAGPPTDIPKDELWQYMPAFAKHLGARLAADQYALVHAHFWMSGAVALMAAARSGIPVIQTFHALGTVKRRHQGRLDTSPRERVKIEAQLCRSADHVIATCQDEVSELQALGLDPADATVVPCGVDTSLFTPASSTREVGRRILTIGRLVERKGVGDVITALADMPGVELTVAGGPSWDALVADPEVARLRHLAASNGTADRVTFVGRADHDEIPQLIRSCDLVVAVPWYEPFGIVPLEAMACGRPVVGSAVGGLLDTIVAGQTGELVPPRRPDLLAPVVVNLMQDPARRQAYGRAGVERVAAVYRWERVAEATEAVYDSVLAHRVTSPQGANR